MSEIIYGRNAARESLRARRRHIHKVMIADKIQTSAVIDDIVNLARRSTIPIQRIARNQLDNLARGHQGVALEVGRYPTVSVEDILQRAAKLDEPPFVVGLDHLEDPHNVGAILRTAEAVGVHGIFIPKQRAAGVTPAVVNASAGAAEHLWVAEISNFVQTIRKLKQNGLWVVGVEKAASAISYTEADLTGAIVVVIGSEGKGVSHLVKAHCDFLVRLPMRGQVEALNASVAGALILYETWRARGFQ
jgi:23S rRNA (guanosine2251-2'-O)-methyltransferase